ncbi:MAG: hypothetical protein IPP77_11955 [Bacteroidetes bacterium]|nr:hypothetical protein [Bacteroidota bacterium]
MQFIKRTFPLLFGIFLLSVLVRVPLLDRPLSKHHEFCTALSLRIMQIWYDNGIEKYGFNPVMTYNNEADKFINNHANASGKMVDQAGNYYYVSHPPFAYYFPFAIFKILHVRPDVLPLQIVNLSFHFLSGLFVYFIVCLLSFTRARSYPYRSAIVAFVMYIFMPVTMWFQSNVYMSDMAVHLLFIIGVYTVLKMIIRQRFTSLKYIFFYVTCLGLMIYTSWLGVFFAFGVLVYSLLHVRSNRGFRVLVWSTVIVTFIVLQLIVYQYSQINGSMAYLTEMINRYAIRGSVEPTDQGLFHFLISYLKLFKSLVVNYSLHYFIVYGLVLFFIWLAISRRKLKIIFSENGYRFIWLSVLPILLLHIVFLNYSEHDFTALYASLFVSVLLGVLYDKIKKSGTIPLIRMQLGLTGVVFLMVGQFYLINPPSFFKKAGADTHYKVWGEQIKKESKPDEVVFANIEDPEPQLVWYAGRNIRPAATREEALGFLQERNLKKGIWFRQQNGAMVAEKIAVQE